MFPPSARAEHSDLTGSWVLDASASTFSGNAPSAGTLVISKHGKDLRFAETFRYPNGEKVREFEWKTDNRFHPVAGGNGEVLAHWDGDTLIGARKTGDGMNMESVRFSPREPGRMVETVIRPDQQSTVIWKRP